jgi:hypothetical protein|tara:strand:+ start:3126 stop:3254 length:129 start_codon:yes stop_codon:yes gene_type:complete
MEALYAGLLAWTIELSIAFSILYVLKHEENKVIKKRGKKEEV